MNSHAWNEQYELLRQELIEQARSSCMNGDDLDDRILSRGRCHTFTKVFAERFPNLTRVPGFYNGQEHCSSH